jgi:hypothetical protein
MLNSLGIQVTEPYNALLTAGIRRLTLEKNSEIPQGIYFIKVTYNGNRSEIRKVAILN